MQSLTVRKAITVLLTLVLTLGSFALIGCASNAPAGASSESGTPTTTEGATIDVTVSVDISAAIAENDSTALAIEKTQGAEHSVEVTVPEGATVMDALEASGFDYATTSASFGDYVSGISGLTSGSVGPESGWTFLINGEFSMDAADAAILSAGDTVTWEFVTSYE